MINIPRIHQMETIPEIQEYARLYAQNTEDQISGTYLYKANNRFFGIYRKKTLIGGFILGYPPAFRAIEAFAKPAQFKHIYGQIKDENQYTEISCLWIKPAFQHRLFVHLFLWFAILSVLKQFGTFEFLYGTATSQFASLFTNLFAASPIHQDLLETKHTSIFLANRKQLKKGLINCGRTYLKKGFNKIPFLSGKFANRLNGQLNLISYSNKSTKGVLTVS